MLPRLAPRLSFTFVLGVLLCLPPRASLAQVQALPPVDLPNAQGQNAQFEAPAYVSVVDGAATLERDGRVEGSPLNMPLLSGDRLRTTSGRLEVRFADGGRLTLDNATSVDVMSDELVRLVDGRVRVSMVRTAQVNYRIDSPVGSVRVLEAGEYRVALLHSAQETQLELAVTRGAGEIFTDSGATPVRAGERAYASAGLSPSYAYSYNSANLDDFDRWTDMQRGTVYAASSQSEQHLPADMQTYASTFDSYGDWQYQQDYGYVWYPRVAAEWRPYYNGRWASYPGYGWTWVAGDRFGWPTHHYGRWGISGSAWFWIPSSAWAPAYVSWGYATDYVSWCPLGWNNHAVVSINVFGGSGYYGGSHGHAAWTVVPRGSFGHGYAYANAVHWDRVHDNRQHFSEGGAPGYSRSAAVSRNAAPIRYAGTRTTSASRQAPAAGRSYAGSDRTQAAGRSSQPGTPRYINRGDEIVRSQTGRPSAPRSSPSPEAAPGRGDGRDSAVARSYPQTSPRGYGDSGTRASAPSSPGTYSSPSSRADAAPRTLPYAGQAQRPSSTGIPSAPNRGDGRQPRAMENQPNRPSYPSREAAPQNYPQRTMPPSSGQRPMPPSSGQRPMPPSSGQSAMPRPEAPQAAPRSYSRPDGGGRPSGGYEHAAPRQEPPPQRSESAPARQGGGSSGSSGSGRSSGGGGTAAPRHGGRQE